MSNSYTVIVNQAIDLLNDISIDAYQRKLLPHFPSSIGSHIRHIVDHFRALIDGCSTGHVDYNIRHRQNDVEQFPSSASHALKDIADWLDNLGGDIMDSSITVSTEMDTIEPFSKSCRSTVEREIVFVSSHTIHHYALIRVICSMQNIHISELFGYAPTTIMHLHKTA